MVLGFSGLFSFVLFSRIEDCSERALRELTRKAREPFKGRNVVLWALCFVLR